MKRRIGFIFCCSLAAVIGVTFYVGCGSSESSTTTLSIGPTAGITAPTTVGSSRQVEAFTSIASNLEFNPRFDLQGDSTGCGSGVDLDTQLTQITDAAKAANLTATETALANFSTVSTYRAACYGPTWTDNATGSSVNRPSGDLGIVYATASSTDTTACVACQVEALLSSGPDLGNRLVKVVAYAGALLSHNSVSLPAAGATVDLLDATVLTTRRPTISGITFSVFKLSRLTDRDGHAIYKLVLTFTDSASKSGSLTVYHEAIAADNSEFKGLVTGTLPHTPTMGGSGNARGVSFVYHLQSSIYKFQYKTAANRETATTDFFNTSSIVDFSKRAAFGEDGHYILGYFDKTNNNGVLHYAWQAGASDGSVRAFSVNVAAGTKGSRTGTGYFGFGAAMSSVAASGAPWMTKMHCNWLNGLSSGPSITKAQKQSMTEGTTGFTASSSSINFAPTNDCNAASWTVSGATDSFLNGSKSTTANDLVALPAASDFSYNFATAGNEPTFTIP